MGIPLADVPARKLILAGSLLSDPSERVPVREHQEATWNQIESTTRKEIRMAKRIESIIVVAVAVGVVLAVLLLPLGLTFAEGADGKALYGQKCAMCHGADGVAKESWAKKGMKNLNDPAWQKANAQESIEKVIAGGRRRMPKYAGKVTPEVIKVIAAHIKTLATEK